MRAPATASGQGVRRPGRVRRRLIAGLEPRFIGCALAGLVLPALAIFLAVSLLGDGSGTPTAIPSMDLSGISETATRVVLASQPSATDTPTATDTHTPAPTDTASPPPSPTETVEPTPTETDIPVPSDTPSPTATPTSTPAPARPSPTRPRPTSTPSANSTQQLPSPVLLAPAEGADFEEAEDVLLQWQPVGTLGPNAYYVVFLSYLHSSGAVWYDETPPTKDTRWLASEHSYLLDFSVDGVFTWSVQVLRDPKYNGRPSGTPLSPMSAERTFIWKRGGGGTAPPPPPPMSPTVPPP